MTSTAKLKKETGKLAKAAWATLGIPLDFPAIDERAEGVVDVEALIIATLLAMENDRLATDLPAWLNCFSGLISFQRLKTLFTGLSRKHSALVRTNLKQIYFTNTPKEFRNIFDINADPATPVDKTVGLRARKINTIENVAGACLMIKNRLIYGTGFRADLITLTHIRGLSMKGTDRARLICADNSTVSRIVKDLKASRFMNQNGERVGSFEVYPGMFMSVVSVSNLCEMMDATEFSIEALKQESLETLNFKTDTFGRKILLEVFSRVPGFGSDHG